jgi:hypothetical protein
MTQVQSIQANINDAELELNRILNLVPTNEVEKHHFAGSIRQWKKEIAEFKRSLKLIEERNR